MIFFAARGRVRAKLLGRIRLIARDNSSKQ